MLLLIMTLMKGRNKILLHLEAEKDFGEIEDHVEAPYGLCQKGIAKSINLSRNRTSEIIRDLVEKGLVQEHINRVVGLKRRRKVYSLSSEGYKKAKEIRSQLEEKEVTIKTESSDTEVKLKQVDSYISSREPLLVALNKMDQDEIIDLTESEKDLEDIFAGRTKEMKILHKKLEDVREKDASTLLVKGNAGIGKTRFIDEFKKKALSDNFRFYSGKGLYEKSEPYLPFKVAFKTLNDSENSSPLHLFENGGETHPRDDESIKEERREMIFSKTTENLRALSKKNPMVIFIDDLQWVDKASLMLFHHFSDRLEDAPVLLIGAYRPEDVEDEDFLRELLQRMNREHLYEEIELGPLRWEDTKEIIQGQIGRSDLPEDFVQVIHETSEGNPLFSKELVKQMIEEDVLDPKKNRFPSKTDEIELPKVVTDIIERRIKRLDKENLKVLRLGSVIGEEIPFLLLESLTEIDSFDLLDYIDILTGLDIWENDADEDIFSFVHGLIHEAVYYDIPKQMRKELHGQVAESMEDIFKEDIDDHYSDIGHHYKIADKFSKAYEFYRKAGEKAERLYAHEDAIEMYEEALKLTEKSNLEEERWYLLEKLGDVYKTIGKYDASLEHYEKISEGKTDKEYQQKIYRKMGSVYEREGNFDKALDTVKKGLSKEDEQNIESCRLLYKKGDVEVLKGEYSTAESDLLRALERWDKFGGDKEYAEIHQGLGNVYLYKGEYDESINHLEKALETWRDIGDREGESATLNNLGIVYLNKGNLDRSLDYYEQSLDIRKERGDKRDIHSTLNNIGTIYLKKGEMEKAFEHYKESLDIWEEIGDQQGIAISLINMGEYHLKKGDYKSALKKQKKSLDISKKINFKKGEAASLSNIGKIYLLKGDLEKTKENYKKSLDICRDIGDRSLLPNPLRGLAEVFFLEEELDRANELAEEALEVSSEIGIMVEEGISHRILGKVYRKKGGSKKAEKEFKKGKEVLEKVGDKKELAELLYDYSFLLKDQGKMEKRTKFLERACSIFESMDMEHWIEKCEKEVDSGRSNK